MSNKDNALDSVGGFMTMIEGFYTNRSNWSIQNILSQWVDHIDCDFLPQFKKHTITKIMVRLILRGYQKHKLLLPRGFMTLYHIIYAEDWWDKSERQVRKITFQMTDMFNIHPYHFINEGIKKCTKRKKPLRKLAVRRKK